MTGQFQGAVLNWTISLIKRVILRSDLYIKTAWLKVLQKSVHNRSLSEKKTQKTKTKTKLS